LAELQPAGYSLSLLQAVDRALMLRMDDRPQSIDEFAVLIDMPVAGIDDVLSAKKPGTMLVPVEETPEPTSALDWRRYKVPAIGAAGIIVGIVAGALLFSGSDDETPETASVDTAVTAPPAPAEAPPATTANEAPAAVQTQAPPAVESPPPAAVEAEPIVLVYIRMLEGETLQINGESKALRPATNGYASLTLPAGEFTFELQGSGKTRTQTLNIAKPGTWLVNP
jgi:hypothetical protein